MGAKSKDIDGRPQEQCMLGSRRLTCMGMRYIKICGKPHAHLPLSFRLNKSVHAWICQHSPIQWSWSENVGQATKKAHEGVVQHLQGWTYEAVQDACKIIRGMLGAPRILVCG